jgi:hypothetical protein
MLSSNCVITKFLWMYMPGVSKHMACVSSTGLVNCRPTLSVTGLTLCHQPVTQKHTSTWQEKVCSNLCLTYELHSDHREQCHWSWSGSTSTSTISLYSLSPSSTIHSVYMNITNNNLCQWQAFSASSHMWNTKASIWVSRGASPFCTMEFLCHAVYVLWANKG